MFVFRGSQQGFTLIELMVVMVLLGLLTSLAVTSIGGNLARELEVETNRMHALLREAANEAVFTNSEIGVQVSEEGYSFITYDEQEQSWQAASSQILSPQTLPEWLTLEFQREGEAVELPKRKQESEDREFGEEEKVIKPDFMFLSSGEITNFTLTLSLRDDVNVSRDITLNEYGEIILPHIEEAKEDE